MDSWPVLDIDRPTEADDGAIQCHRCYQFTWCQQCVSEHRRRARELADRIRDLWE